MKKILFITIVLFACEKDEEDPKTRCQTGVLKGTNTRVTIRCCTQQQFLAGDNVKAGGTANWDNYTDHKWEICSNCK